MHFTADLHLDHYNIMKIMKRPFSSLEEMNESLIANINKVISVRDELWILGDFAFKNGQIHAGRINGRKHLILGNHDDKRINQYAHLFDSVQEVKYLRHEGSRFYLSHYAHRVWRNSHYGSYHLYGHSHGMLEKLYGRWGRSMDVGVDCWNFKPVHIDTVLSELKGMEYTNHHPENAGEPND